MVMVIVLETSRDLSAGRNARRVLGNCKALLEQEAGTLKEAHIAPLQMRPVPCERALSYPLSSQTDLLICE